jgi:hypothetical protein
MTSLGIILTFVILSGAQRQSKDARAFEVVDCKNPERLSAAMG